MPKGTITNLPLRQEIHSVSLPGRKGHKKKKDKTVWFSDKFKISFKTLTLDEKIKFNRFNRKTNWCIGS